MWKFTAESSLWKELKNHLVFVYLFRNADWLKYCRNFCSPASPVDHQDFYIQPNIFETKPERFCLGMLRAYPQKCIRVQSWLSNFQLWSDKLRQNLHDSGIQIITGNLTIFDILTQPKRGSLGDCNRAVQRWVLFLGEQAKTATKRTKWFPRFHPVFNSWYYKLGKHWSENEVVHQQSHSKWNKVEYQKLKIACYLQDSNWGYHYRSSWSRRERKDQSSFGQFRWN